MSPFSTRSLQACWVEGDWNFSPCLQLQFHGNIHRCHGDRLYPPLCTGDSLRHPHIAANLAWTCFVSWVNCWFSDLASSFRTSQILCYLLTFLAVISSFPCSLPALQPILLYTLAIQGFYFFSLSLSTVYSLASSTVEYNTQLASHK